MIDDFVELSQQLKDAKRWILWKRIKVEGKKDRKVPFYANGTPRNGELDSPSDISMFATYNGALSALSSGKYAGIGFALGADGTGNYWQGIDFDGLSKRPELGYLQEDLDGYVEISPSGDGVHAIGYGRKFAALASNASGIEAYSGGRYFTVTGKCSGLGEPVCLADYVENVLAPLHSVNKVSTDHTATFLEVSPAVINDLRSALFYMPSDDRELWIRFGMALKSLGNNGRSLWLSWAATSESFDALENAKTWDSFKPYKIGHKSIFSEAQSRGWINPANKNHAPLEEIEEYTENIAQEWITNISGDIDYIIPFPGVARDIQDWILRTSVKKQPGLAFSSTLAILSVVIGRRIQIEGIKGNFYSLCLAESGEGKDWPLKACYKILDSIGMGHHVYGDMASGSALVEAINETPSALLSIDEVGHYFASITSKNSNQFSREIMPIITKIYTSASDSYVDKKRKGGDALRITEPNLSVLGMSTEKQIMDALKTSEVVDGSLARFMVIFGLNNVNINQNRENNTYVPDIIKNRLESLKGGNFMLSSHKLVLSREYSDEKRILEMRFNDLAIKIGMSQGDKSMFKSFYYRLSVRAVQMALLIDQCTDIRVLHWCAELAEKSCDVFIKKFIHLAADNENERFVKIIENRIKESGVTGITKDGLLQKTRMVESGMRRRILADLEDAGLIFIANEKGRTKSKTCYYWKK